MLRAYGMLDAEIGKENDFIKNARSGFMTTHVIGSPQTVSERCAALVEECDLDGLMLIFPDYLKDMPVFAAEILPKLRALKSPIATLEPAHAG